MANTEDMDVGVRIGGKQINNLRYADDTTLITENKEDLERLVTKVAEESRKAGLKLNLKKTTFMTTGSKECLKINDEVVHMANEVKYLGVTISSSGYCTEEIKRRIILGKAAERKLHKFIKDAGISLKTKIQLIEKMVFPIVLYGCESWTLRKAEKKRLDAFEMWAWRKIMNVKWEDKKTNVEILEKIKPEISLEAQAIKLKLKYFGHIMRSQSLEKEIMLGMVEGSRKRGRKRTRWHNEIIRTTNLTWEDILKRVQDRSQWRKLVHKITNGRKRQFE